MEYSVVKRPLLEQPKISVFGADREINPLRFANWVGGCFYMGASGVPVSLHENVRYADLGVDYHEPSFQKDAPNECYGRCGIRYNKKAGLFWMITKIRSDLAKDTATFARGHEEGHGMAVSGQLSNMCGVALRMGYDFDFLTKDIAIKSDMAAHRIFSYMSNVGDGKLVYGHYFNEDIANVGGLIALTRAGTDPQVLGNLVNAIESTKEVGNILFEHDGFFRSVETSMIYV
jgi:hypothetical protein